MSFTRSVKRRAFLQKSLLGLTAFCTPTLYASELLLKKATKTPQLLSAAKDNKGKYHICIFSPWQQQIFSLPLPHRAHSITPHPQKPVAVCVDRRPGQRLYVFDYQSHQLLKQITALPKHHFYGHGVFSHDGEYFFTTEQHWPTSRGQIGVYQTHNFKRVDTLISGGMGPHELHLHPQRNQLIVANGGIKTHPDYDRRKLNIDAMEPNLSLIDLSSGDIQQQWSFNPKQLSIRHLDVGDDGLIIVGLQYQGDQNDIVPLVLYQQGNSELQPMHTDEIGWLQLNQYIASVCVMTQSNTAVVTAPRANKVTFWDLKTKQLRKTLPLTDAAGAVALNDHLCAITTGTGEVHLFDCKTGIKKVHTTKYNKIAWDNHLNTTSV
ncbi:DUF1513 domain-containing protein [Zooshikella harenae]|uniref:DUF1513 domain-containing protein n=1 Tax=Zooshikella harenae TaxID=2827238 RepID=A0ABS5ZFI5_9GAMM|nr:DUF1513 domain-containing protein [Zooshikella harenae]MBU2711747.1 DUF1513 domain-containing protein [Zooshikella harenae]